MALRTERKDQKNKPRKEKVQKVQSCYFTQTGTVPDYKDVLVMRKFLTDRFKLMPQKITGLTAKNQRLLTIEVKKARFMALVPYTDQHSAL